MGTRSSQLWQISQLLGLYPPIQTIPEFREHYPQIAIKYPKLGDDQLDEVIRRMSEAKSNDLDPLAYYPPVAIPKKPRSRKADRNAEILAAVRAIPRESYAAIGRRFNLSGEAVRQIVNKQKEKAKWIIKPRLAGGVATTASGISIGWVTPEDHEKPEECPECIGYDNQGRAFAIFWKGQRVQKHPDAIRSDNEAIQRIARLILNWETWTYEN